MITDGESSRIIPMDDDRTNSIIELVTKKRGLIKDKRIQYLVTNESEVPNIYTGNPFNPNEISSIEASTDFDVSEIVEKFTMEDLRLFYVLEESKVGKKLTRGELQYLVKLVKNCYGVTHFVDGYTKGRGDLKEFKDVADKLKDGNRNIIDLGEDL